MPDLTVVALIKAKPGSEGVVRDALAALVPPTREEDGCSSYELYESATAAGTFVTVESWREQGDLDAHMKSPHVGATFAAAGEGLDGAPEIHVLTPIDVG